MVKITFDYRRLYTYRLAKWTWHLWRKDKILITYFIDQKKMRFEESLEIAHVSEAQAYGMGFTRGKKIKDELKYLPFKTYVKFIPDIQPPFPLIIMDDSGAVRENYETASTLYDHWKSDSKEKFVKGMTKTTLTGGEQKKLILVAMIGLVAAVGLYFVLFR
jgi:hypothetical protein